MAIEVMDLVKSFGSVYAVDHVSFSVGDEILALLGPSGCGKTTTLRCIAGLEVPSGGKITIGGKVVSGGDGGFVPPEKRGIGMVFQSYALWPHMRVFDNVAYPLRVRKYKPPEVKKRVSEALELVNLPEREKRYPAQLSGGEQQRVALARAICYEPQILLLDEPLSNLDAKIREKTRMELRRTLKKIGISSVYVTHDQEEAFVVADRIAVMRAGKIIQIDRPEMIYQNPSNEFIAGFVGQTNILRGRVVTKDGKGESHGSVELPDIGGLRCTIPAELSPGDECTVVIRSNEMGLYGTDAGRPGFLKCKIMSREYKGAVTDHKVIVGKTELMVTTHRFCKSAEVDGSSNDAYLNIEPEAIRLISPAVKVTT